MHQPIPEQGKWLRQVVIGFFAYHAVPTNSRALHTFRHRITDLWRRSLQRRSHKERGLTGVRLIISDACIGLAESAPPGHPSAAPLTKSSVAY
jgi:hypothetical protein